MKKRTNIEIETDYIERIQTRYGLTTIKDAVDLALKRLAAEIPTKEEVLALEGFDPDFEIGGKDEPGEEI